MTRKNIVLFALVLASVLLAACDGSSSDCQPGMATSPSGADCAASNPANQSPRPMTTDEKVIQNVKNAPAQLQAGVNDAVHTRAGGLVRGDTTDLTQGAVIDPTASGPCPKGGTRDSDGDCRIK